MTATISLFISSDILSILYPAISVAILLDGERLEDIALLNIVELCKSYAALKVLRDLLDIVLETAQGRNLVLGDDDAVAHHANLRVSCDLAAEDIAAGDVADGGDFDYLADFRSALLNLAELRSEHALDSRLNLVDAVIDYPVAADVTPVALGVLRRNRVGSDIEADDYRVRCVCKHDIGLVDSADAAVNDFNSDFLVRELFKALLNSLDRALDIRLDDDVEFLELALLEG